MWAISTNNCLETLDGSCGVSILSCLLLDCFYVGSLYIWRGNLPRDHRSTIKRRFISVSVVSALSVVTVWKWAESMELHPSPYVPVLFDLLGVRLEGLLAAAVLPLVLTMLLFLGPLAQCALASGRDCPPEARLGLDPRSLAACVSDARWLRNQVMAPLTEELVFRACMLPMLVPCTGSIGAILISPLFFSLAHFHHVIERLHAGQDTVSEILLCAVIQFCYTYVFGVYSSFLFIRTGHLLGAVLCHSLCNAIGFPDVGGVMEHPQHLVILFCYLLGVLLFVLLLFPLTDPILYGGAPPLCGPPLHPQAACLA